MSAAITRKTPEKSQFGDFQTPPDLATAVCGLLFEQGITPRSVVEPTCGYGTFILASLAAFASIERGLGVEISPSYVAAADAAIRRGSYCDKASVIQSDFFQLDWIPLLRDLPDPLLVIGNPPWITNAHIGTLSGSNLPVKSNFHNRNGLDAITGKANFDISEWMLIRALEWLNGRRGCLAMLCKTTVARKLLSYAWKSNLHITRSSIHLIDASLHFGAAVDACLLTCHFDSGGSSDECSIYASFDSPHAQRVIGYRDGEVVSSIDYFDRWKHVKGIEHYKWRSGIKHDCARVMELSLREGRYVNGLGEYVDIETVYLFPMLKTSEVAKVDSLPKRVMIVPQSATGESTAQIQHIAPKTWKYLNDHGHLLDARGSSIYIKRPRFSVFGVGRYSFAPWKVAISGFYKRFVFRTIGPHNGLPVVFDDASYFLSCQSQDEAMLITQLLNSEPAQGFFSSCVFWDSKRPITVDLLRRLDLKLVAREVGLEKEFSSCVCEEQSVVNGQQLLLI